MTHAEFEFELVEALNMLLEDERASVEMEVALASGATEYSEREALSVMGVEDIHFCEQLRVEMERAGLPVTPQINGIVFQVIGAERYDDRLRAFAHHQQVVAEHAKELQESNLDGALREALEGITTTHERHTQWTEQRAGAFAATRTLEFGPTGRMPSSGATPDADDPDAAEQSTQAAAYTDSRTMEELSDTAQSAVPVERAHTDDPGDPGALDLVTDAATGAPPALGLSAEEAAPDTKPAPTVAVRKPRARASSASKATPTSAKARATRQPKAPATAPRRTRRAPSTGDANDA